MSSPLCSSDAKNERGRRGFAKSSVRAGGTQAAAWFLEKRNTITPARADPERSFNGEHRVQHRQTGTCHKVTTRTRRGHKPEVTERRRAAASPLPSPLRSQKFVASKVLLLGLKKREGAAAASQVSFPRTRTAACKGDQVASARKRSCKPEEQNCWVMRQVFLALLS